MTATERNDGSVRLTCHSAGCDWKDIAAAIGLKPVDLYPPKSKAKANGRKIVATYDYPDESGELLFQVVRYDPKDFRQRRGNGRGGWEWSLKGTRRVLFRLPQVLEAVENGETVYVVEGEKDVEALERAGVVATCNPQGAGKWSSMPDAGHVLAGATVVVVADRDEPGRRHAAEVAADLRGHGCTVTVVETPGPHKDVAEMLGAGLALDALVATSEADREPAPTWSGEPGHIVLDAVHDELTRYVVFPSPEAADAVTLYTVATHGQTVWEHASRLVIKSPLKRCGKTRLQDVIGELVHRPITTSNISVAALVRSIDENDPPTLILDEADSVFATRRGERSEGAEDLRGILNAGHGRSRPYLRWNASTNTIERCATFAMAIIAGIGDMPDTIEDRAVVVSLRRRAPGETVASFRRKRSLPPLRALHQRLQAWVRAHLDALADAEPDLPVEDRAADVWEPLVALADFAGGDWPERARRACRGLTGDAAEHSERDVSEELLTDLATVFGDAEKLPTAVILERLHKLPESRWATFHRGGNPLTDRGLVRLLKPYKVKSTTFRVPDGGTPKGYLRADLAEVWARYTHPPATAATPQHDDENTAADLRIPGVADDVADSGKPSATPPEQELWSGVADVADVVDNPANGAPLTVADECPMCGEGGYDRTTYTCRAADCAGF